MAKTTKKKAASAPARQAPARQAPGRQAPAGAWSPDTLLTALRRGSAAKKVAVLKKAGILDANGKLTRMYKNWGSKVTRTPDAQDVEA
jgi:hypothetical protein